MINRNVIYEYSTNTFFVACQDELSPSHFNKNDATCLDCHLAIECVQFKIFTFDVIVPLCLSRKSVMSNGQYLHQLSIIPFFSYENWL